MKYLKYILIIVFISGCKSKPKWNVIEAKGNCTARHKCCFVAHKNALYLVGVRGDKPVDKFTIASNSWSSLKQSPIEMNHITHVYTFNTEKDIWINAFFNMKDWPTIYDENLKAKPVYFGVLGGLKETLETTF